MAKFIELHNHGRAELINVDGVQLVNKQEDGTVKIFFIGDEAGSWLEVDESYSAVKGLVMGVNDETTVKDSLRAEMEKK